MQKLKANRRKGFQRCKDMVRATGWKGLDSKCKHQGMGILLLLFTCTLFVFCVFIHLLSCCQCGRGPDKGVPEHRKAQRGEVSTYHFEQSCKQEEEADEAFESIFSGYTKPTMPRMLPR